MYMRNRIPVQGWEWPVGGKWKFLSPGKQHFRYQRSVLLMHTRHSAKYIKCCYLLNLWNLSCCTMTVSTFVLKNRAWGWCSVFQLCLTLCDPMNCRLHRSPPGSSVHGILQARILEWIAMPSFRGSSWPRNWTPVSYVFCINRRHSVILYN